jgi:hypothetical protein
MNWYGFPIDLKSLSDLEGTDFAIAEDFYLDPERVVNLPVLLIRLTVDCSSLDFVQVEARINVIACLLRLEGKPLKSRGLKEGLA